MSEAEPLEVHLSVSGARPCLEMPGAPQALGVSGAGALQALGVPGAPQALKELGARVRSRRIPHRIVILLHRHAVR